MQSMKSNPNKPTKLGVWGTAKYIYGEAGLRGLYRGVTPRVALGVWQTICMVALGDVAKVLPINDYADYAGIHRKFDRRKANWTLVFRFILLSFDKLLSGISGEAF
jgi:hypothetical protein